MLMLSLPVGILAYTTNSGPTTGPCIAAPQANDAIGADAAAVRMGSHPSYPLTPPRPSRTRDRPPQAFDSTVINPLSIQACAAYGKKRTHMYGPVVRVVSHATRLQQAPPQPCRPQAHSRPASRCRKPCRPPCRCPLSQLVDCMEHAKSNSVASLATGASGEHWPCSPALHSRHHSGKPWSPDLGGVQPFRGSWY
eukprot:CAMPEP_0203946768 /NCGR_PEP_ID=MMETSP0359-20131031/81924_1 /ASSEMBLY_ACC=CAM_ASM_000338 /TAXON_ID=268821 /ORGANISM="Scrippsiella Hangoei, Strain SHTV-5" /LENGTH=194 /DNA_ID=CAMNT_0050878107 /DNA_START=50 /DNA_END=634 /DNA_ORIENTATION=+